MKMAYATLPEVGGTPFISPKSIMTFPPYSQKMNSLKYRLSIYHWKANLTLINMYNRTMVWKLRGKKISLIDQRALFKLSLNVSNNFKAYALILYNFDVYLRDVSYCLNLFHLYTKFIH